MWNVESARETETRRAWSAVASDDEGAIAENVPLTTCTRCLIEAVCFVSPEVPGERLCGHCVRVCGGRLLEKARCPA